MHFLKRKRPESSDTSIDPIQRLLVESGVSPEFFNRAILGSLYSFAKHLNWDATTLVEITDEGRYILSRRRNYLLPVGCEPEDLHSSKDLWTFTVWIIYLIHKSGEPLFIEQHHMESNVKLPLLEAILDITAWQWLLSNKEALEAIIGFVVRDEMNNNVSAILELLGQGRQSEEEELPRAVAALTPSVQELANLYSNEIASTGGPSKIEQGSEFIKHLRCSIEDLPAWATKVAEYQFDVESPKAFIEYAAMAGLNWKHVQKGVQRLGFHVPDPSTGKVFRKVGGKFVMRLNLQGGRNA